MSTTAPPRLMTTEELLALPDDGIERWLIRGKLREGSTTRRNRWHSRTEARIVHILQNWLDRQPQPRGVVYSGEGGFRLTRDPDTTVGINVAYVSPDVAAREPDDTAPELFNVRHEISGDPHLPGFRVPVARLFE